MVKIDNNNFSVSQYTEAMAIKYVYLLSHFNITKQIHFGMWLSLRRPHSHNVVLIRFLRLQLFLTLIPCTL